MGDVTKLTKLPPKTFSFFAFVSYWFHGNRTWEKPEDVIQKLSLRKPLGVWTFGKAEMYAERSGKLKRVG